MAKPKGMSPEEAGRHQEIIQNLLGPIPWGERIGGPPDRGGHPNRRPTQAIEPSAEHARSLKPEEALEAGQLSLSMPARTLESMHSFDVIDMRTGQEDRAGMQASKREHNLIVPPNGKPSLLESVGQRGVQTPVSIAWGEGGADTPHGPAWRQVMTDHAVAVANGNHRVMAAYDTDPNMEVPTLNFDQSGEYWKHHGREAGWYHEGMA